MSESIQLIFKKYVEGKSCSREELLALKSYVSKPVNEPELEAWAKEYWEQTYDSEPNTSISFNDILSEIKLQEQIQISYSNQKTRSLLRYYQKIAAVLLIPILLSIATFYYLNSNTPSEMVRMIANRGQKSQVILPDGTKIWLNSETILEYPVDFNKKTRNVNLTGEAYFEVAPNKSKPFIVKTAEVSMVVLGTSFNIKAYSGEPEIETTLYTGSLKIETPGNIQNNSTGSLLMTPGQSVKYSKLSQALTINKLTTNETLGWKNNRLVFNDDTFDKLVRKIERWYDVKIIYDNKNLDQQKLTVELLEGEQLEKLMQIIQLTLKIDYKIDKNTIYITQKSKNMTNEAK